MDIFLYEYIPLGYSKGVLLPYYLHVGVPYGNMYARMYVHTDPETIEIGACV